MNPNEINKLKEKAPLPLLIILILFFIPELLLKPEADNFQSANNAYDLSLNTAREKVRSDSDLQRRFARLNQTREILQKINAVLPQASALPDLITKLHLLASENSVVLEEVSYSMQKQFERLDVPGYRIIMSLSAGYSQMRSFLEAVENMESPVIINEIFMTESGRYALTIRMLTK